MLSKFIKLRSLVIILIFLFISIPANAQTSQVDGGGAGVQGLTKDEAANGIATILATDPSKCGTASETVDKKLVYFTPRNCLFLEEPIGGKPNYDLYVVECKEVPMPDGNKKRECKTILWGGGALTEGQSGPIQAILTETPDKPYQGPFGLLYGYISLIYNYLSGLIIGVSVLFVVIGGVQITLYGADEEQLNKGKARIVKAIVGLIIWFTASLILYTINPTFYAF